MSYACGQKKLKSPFRILNERIVFLFVFTYNLNVFKIKILNGLEKNLLYQSFITSSLIIN